MSTGVINLLKNLQYDFFTAQELSPSGWIKKQLETQASGLCGNLDKVWPDIKDSAWIGGNREGWERVPYWLDGFIPMAYLLQNDDLIKRAKVYVDAIINRQHEDGWICPCSEEERSNYDTWAVLLITKVLVVYAQCSGETERIKDVLLKCFKNFAKHLNNSTLRNWGSARWFEGLISIYWLYEQTQEQWLLKLANILKVQGFDWKSLFANNFLDTLTDGWDYYSHVVNIAMALKSEALLSRITDDNPEEFVNMALDYLDKKHSTATGHFTGDEQIAGDSPIHGTELCGVVEAMYSYEILFSITGNTIWLDRLEKLAFNALPAAISPDMWTHQYDQLTNQIECSETKEKLFRTNTNDAHIFGLEPNFGCCTANFGQGWPKFTLTSFMKCEDGIAACSIVPAKVETTLKGAAVKCEAITNYPFDNTVKYIVTTNKPTNFTFKIRIPACAEKVNTDCDANIADNFIVVNKEWNATTEINVEFKFKTIYAARPDNMVCLWHGPLLYSVAIDEEWKKTEYTKDGVERKYPYCDYNIYPRSPWNYAFIDGESISITKNCFDKPFSPQTPPICITTKMVKIDWGYSDGHCMRTPTSRSPISAPGTVKLIPYGCTNLRMTEMPKIKL